MKNSLTGYARIIVLGAIFVLGAAGTVAAVTETQGEDLSVTAVFADASPLIPGNEVKASGVTVGEVGSIALRQGRAHVEMIVERSVLPMHEDASATITSKDLLGERFINLERGSPSAPLLDEAGVIPESQTSRVVELQEVLNAVDDPTGTALAALVTTLGEGVNRQGPEIAAAISALEPAMRQTDELGHVLSEHNQLLTQLVDTVQPVAGALATDRGRSLDRLVGSSEQTLSAVATNRAAVQEMLRQLPATLDRARRSLGQVAGVADAATPTLASMRPVTDDLTGISGELRRFSDAADPALGSLPPVLDRAQALLDETAPLVRALRPFGEDLRGVTAASRTISEQALDTRLTNLMMLIRNWSLSTNGYDGLSHYFRGAIVPSPKAAGHTAAGPIPGSPDGPVPDVPLPGDSGALPDPAPGDSATGLTSEQEHSMLGQLLGGR